MLQKGYSLDEFPNKGLVVSIRNRMQCRGSLVRWEERKGFPSGEGQARQRAKADMYWFLMLYLGPHPGPPLTVQAWIPRKKHIRCIKRKMKNRSSQETGQRDSLCVRILSL